MNNARKPSEADREKELAEMDMLPKREGQRRADDQLRALLNSPPDPHITPPKPAARAKKK